MNYNYAQFHTDNDIREVLTFIQRPVTGERSLADRYAGPVEDVFETFVAPRFVRAIQYNDLPEAVACRIYRAALMRVAARTMGQQDVILTTSGLGVVSTSSVAPASAERRSELVRSLTQSSDHLFMAHLRDLAAVDGWLASEPGRFWAQSPVHSLESRQSLDDFIDSQVYYANEFDSMRHHVLGNPLADAVAVADLVPDSPTWLVSIQALVCSHIRRIERAEFRPGAAVVSHRDIACHLQAVSEAHDLWSKGEPFNLWNDTPLRRFTNSRRSSGFFF